MDGWKPRDAFRGHSRSPNMVPFHRPMLGVVSYYCATGLLILQYNIPIRSIVNIFSVLLHYCNTVLFLVLVLSMDIGIANWSTNTKIPRISRTAKYNRQLSVSSRCIHRCWRSSKWCVIICVTKTLEQSATLSSLDRYPHVRSLYVQMNTGVPSSAAAERLFSLGGRIFHRCELDWAVITLKCWPFCVWVNGNWLCFKSTKHYEYNQFCV